VSRLEIAPLDDATLDEAAALLADRHARHRGAEPLLPVIADFRAQLEATVGQEGARGALARAGGRLVGYLVGAPVGETGIEVGLAGHAAAEPEVARDLYAHLAQGWVDAGRTRHAVYLPAYDGALVDAWFRLAFGLQFSFAVREVSLEPPVEAGVAIRLGRPDDATAAATLERSLWEHQVRSPSFSGADVPSLDDLVEEWAGTWADPSFTHVVAEAGGRVVGQALLYVRPRGDLRIPDRSIDVAQVETLPELRGRGVGRALFAYVTHWAREQGYEALTADWRTVNLLSSRFWTHRGFRPVFHRLSRVV
jgi:GNAT superfamily N-acetyltransferase